MIADAPYGPGPGWPRRITPIALPRKLLSSVPDDLGHLGRGRGVAAALGADDAVDDGHADAGQVAELHAFQNGFSRRMLRLVHDDKVRRASDLDDAAVEGAHPRGVAGGKAEGDFRRHLA